MSRNGLKFNGVEEKLFSGKGVRAESVVLDEKEIKSCLLSLDRTSYMVIKDGLLGISTDEPCDIVAGEEGSYAAILAAVPPMEPDQLGDASFREAHGLRYSYFGGSMANGISSAEMVIALGQQGFLCSFGAGGLLHDKILSSIQKIKQALPNGPYACNLIHSPSEPALEKMTVDLFLEQGVTLIEASAFLALTPSVVRYRAAGLSVDAAGNIQIQNRIIAKVSRREVAERFIRPAPLKILQELVSEGLITEQQAALAQQVPMADDITAEADSGGHTDNRPLVSLLPSIIALRDRIEAESASPIHVRVGVGGGIGTPEAALAAFAMGAAYIVTGSINQACVEADIGEHVKKILAEADMAEVQMAPAADMFEMGVKVQVLKRGTLFPMRAQKLYDLYKDYDSIESIPEKERENLEKRFFQKSIDSIWEETQTYFSERDPQQIERARQNPKRKMALIFRWYLGLSSLWALQGVAGREMDYQIWSGPAIGAFNSWTQDTPLAKPGNRRVADVARQIMTGAAYLSRLQYLKLLGFHLPPTLTSFSPES